MGIEAERLSRFTAKASKFLHQAKSRNKRVRRGTTYVDNKDRDSTRARDAPSG